MSDQPRRCADDLAPALVPADAPLDIGQGLELSREFRRRALARHKNLCVAIACFAAVSLLVGLLFGGPNGLLGCGLLVLPIAGLCMMMIMGASMLDDGATAIDQLLASRICPACEYSLLGAPLKGTCVACSECGTNWDLARSYGTCAPVASQTPASMPPPRDIR